MSRLQTIRVTRQAGTALVMALLVVAIASVAATGLMQRQRIDVRRTDNVLTLDQTFIYARAAESWAGQVLLRDALENKTDSLLDKWSALLEPIPIEGGALSAQVFDQQARFNLNNLVDDSGRASNKDIAAFERLLTALQLDTALAAAIVDWMDADINPLPAGAEDIDYLALDTPYRTSNQRLASTSELRLVRGVTAGIYEKLQPYITVLPVRTSVNVNTAEIPVLMAVIKGLDESAAAGIIGVRTTTPYADESSFRGQQALQGLEVDNISVDSHFFMIETSVQFGRSRIRQNSLVERKNNDKGRAGIIVLARSRGGLS
jgi:general secretion pathway protein K